MQILINGKLAKYKHDLVNGLIKFSLSKFLTEEQYNSIKIEVDVVNAKLIDGHIAQVYIDEENVKNYPKSFTIEIAGKIPLFRFLISIAHECVHIKQYVLKEMKDKKDNIVIFLRKSYRTDDIEYHDFPWEIEAHGREVFLTINYLKSINKHMEQWVPEEIY